MHFQLVLNQTITSIILAAMKNQSYS